MSISAEDTTNRHSLESLLSFTVYSANLALGKAYRPILNKLQLTYTQYVTIIALWEAGEQTVGSLGEKLYLESNTLTPILKKLEAMGYVERKRDTQDERQVNVVLTHRGRRLYESASSIDIVEHCGLSKGDFLELQRSVVMLRQKLLKIADKSDDQIVPTRG
ncbi:MarR family transcriptional regulator [Paraburkholderia bengalensis]|uniref:HTH-type transcriptional regulator SarZ n=1 Tax=Paraburkholderia bengalensis TaxID=2747562 RepID=A0ABU8IZY1_9BURK